MVSALRGALWSPARCSCRWENPGTDLAESGRASGKNWRRCSDPIVAATRRDKRRWTGSACAQQDGQGTPVRANRRRGRRARVQAPRFRSLKTVEVGSCACWPITWNGICATNAAVRAEAGAHFHRGGTRSPRQTHRQRSAGAQRTPIRSPHPAHLACNVKNNRLDRLRPMFSSVLNYTT